MAGSHYDGEGGGFIRRITRCEVAGVGEFWAAVRRKVS